MVMRLIFTPVISGFLVGGAMLAPYSVAKEACGTVVGLTEEWKLGDRQLTLGSAISPSAVTKLKRRETGAKESRTRGTLTVWFQGQAPETYLCGTKQPCVADNTDRSCDDQEQGVGATLHRHTSRYFMAASRGLEGDLEEAVLPFNNPLVDVSPAMEKLEAGEYWVRFDSLQQATDSVPPIKVEWHPGDATRVQAQGLKADLYRLSLLDRSGEPTGSEAWVLLSQPQEYQVISERFEKMVNQLATWPSDVDPLAIRAILRATLESLAKPARVSEQP